MPKTCQRKDPFGEKAPKLLAFDAQHDVDFVQVGSLQESDRLPLNSKGFVWHVR